MASAHYVSRANKNIYTKGKRITYFGKGEKNKGQQLTRLDQTIPADKDDPILIPKGSSYYWYQFKGSDRQYSLGRPKRSQLTRSGYLSQLYDIMDRIDELSNCSDASELSSEFDGIKSDLESLKDECQEALDRMPESLQETSSSGELLRERIDALENAVSEFDGIDCDDYDELTEDDLRDEAIQDLQLDEDDEESLQDNEKDINDAMERIKADKFQEWLDEKVQEISDISLE